MWEWEIGSRIGDCNWELGVGIEDRDWKLELGGRPCLILPKLLIYQVNHKKSFLSKREVSKNDVGLS